MKIPSQKTDVKHLGQVWQLLCKTAFRENLYENVHTHSIIGKVSLQSSLIPSFIQMICKRKLLFHFSILPAQEHLIASSEALDSAQRDFPLNTVVQALAEAAGVMG